MERKEPLYFGESIEKSKYNRIIRQLEKGSRRMKKDFQIMVIREGLKTLLELIHMDEYALIVERKQSFFLVGVVGEYSEFEGFVERVFTKMAQQKRVINQANLITFLQGDIE